MQRRTFLQAGSFMPFLAKDILGNGLDMFTKTRGDTIPDQNEHQDFFYKPSGAWAADFIPFYNNGRFELFYLLDWRDSDNHGEGTPWYRISTTDFVHFEEHGEMLARGSKSEQDLYVFTGSAIKADDGYHIFYTGHNPNMRSQNKPEQGVMHAVSQDLQHWTKIPGDTFFAPSDKYEMHDWRDPFVFRNEVENCWNMLLAARHKTGIPRRRGLTARCSSTDLKNWTVTEPFYAPDLYFTHECPDLFKLGDWWYLLFSEFTDKVRTRYRMSRSLKGPWLTPARDDFDGHAFYAAKTASDGKNRFLFGWNPTRDEGKDNGGWQWGGNLVVHELHQELNGELSVRLPKTVKTAFGKSLEVHFNHKSGKYTAASGSWTLDARRSFAAAAAEKVPDQCRISTKAIFEPGTTDFGLMIRTSEDFESSYYIRLEPGAQRLVFDKWPRERSEIPFMAELERPLLLKPGQAIQLDLILDGNKGVVYVNNQVAMNFRAYDLKEGGWGIFATGGKVVFTEIQLAGL